jgi:hemerythrin-like domain-containing protein
MTDQPDLSFYFAIHQAQRDALGRYLHAVETLTDGERAVRGKALVRWAKGFVRELEEHHYVEDTFFFPSLRDRVASAGAVIDGLEDDHRRLDGLLARWPAVAGGLADPAVPFGDARADAVAFARELHDFLQRHLAIEDQDLLPLFWRHYTAAEYDAVVEQAVKKGKKAGLWFVAPFTVDCYPEGEARDAFLASVPAVLRLLHRLVRPSYDRLLATALGPQPVDVTPDGAAGEFAPTRR